MPKELSSLASQTVTNPQPLWATHPRNQQFTMNMEATVKLFYDWISVLIKAIYTLLLFILPLVYIFIYLNWNGIFIVGGFLIVVGLEISYNNLRNFYRLLMRKPAVEFSKKYYIDHTKNVKIAWDNILSISLIHRSSIMTLTFELKDRKVYFRQIKNPVFKIIALYFSDILPTLTNLNIVKDSNQTVLEKIISYKNNLH